MAGAGIRATHRLPFAEAAKAARLPDGATIYCLRHTAITRALLAGVPVQAGRVVVRHSVAMIEKTYSASTSPITATTKCGGRYSTPTRPATSLPWCGHDEQPEARVAKELESKAYAAAMKAERKAKFIKELDAIVAMTRDPALMKKLGDELVARSRKEANADGAAMRELLDAERAVMVKKLSAKFKADQMKWFADHGRKHTWAGMLKDNPPKPHTPGTKRRSGAGRKSKLTAEEISQEIIILRGRAV